MCLCFGCKIVSSRPALVVPEPGKVVKIRPKHYLVVPIGNNKNLTQKKCRYVSGAKPSHLRPVFNFSSSSSARTWKVVKTRPKHFSTVLTRNDKNCTSKSVSMFRVRNRVFRARFLTLPTVVVPGPEKGVKIRPKYFSPVLTKNDMNITTNYVGMFRVQTESSGPDFSLYLL